MLENTILRRKAERDLTNSAIANAMTATTGDRVSPESVGHYFTGNAGIPIEKLGPFLQSMGLKIVREEEVYVSQEKFQALTVFAKEAINVLAAGGDARKSKR